MYVDGQVQYYPDMAISFSIEQAKAGIYYEKDHVWAASQLQLQIDTK